MRTLFLIYFIFFSLNVLGDTRGKINEITFYEVGEDYKVTIYYSGQLLENPGLELKSNKIQVNIPGSFVWPKIEKKIKLNSDEYNASIMAYQYTKDLVRFRFIPEIPINEEEKSHIKLISGTQKIELILPKTLFFKKQEAPLNEKYLEKLLKSESEKTTNYLDESTKQSEKTKNYALTAQKKTSNKDTSFFGHILKFILVLFFVLGLFYLAVTFIRKGMLKKGKLGLLSRTDKIDILGQNYLSPKRSIITIKAYDQIFLIANSENGLTYLTEVKDPIGLIKENEKKITGQNFDTKIENENSKIEYNEKKIKLKEKYPYEQKESRSTDEKNITRPKDKESFKLSNSLKEKMKKLRPLQ